VLEVISDEKTRYKKSKNREPTTDHNSANRKGNYILFSYLIVIRATVKAAQKSREQNSFNHLDLVQWCSHLKRTQSKTSISPTPLPRDKYNNSPFPPLLSTTTTTTTPHTLSLLIHRPLSSLSLSTSFPFPFPPPILNALLLRSAPNPPVLSLLILFFLSPALHTLFFSSSASSKASKSIYLRLVSLRFKERRKRRMS